MSSCLIHNIHVRKALWMYLCAFIIWKSGDLLFNNFAIALFFGLSVITLAVLTLNVSGVVLSIFVFLKLCAFAFFTYDIM
jgi:hypothetical protein